MMRDNPPRIDPVLNLTRNQMELVKNIHSVHLAIVSGRDETQVLEFDDSCFEQMIQDEIPTLVREIGALGVIISSPLPKAARYGALVTLIDRTIEAFYAPIVRIINAETMVGDFREASVTNPGMFERIHAELRANWHRRRDG
jgi:hypothetical protein